MNTVWVVVRSILFILAAVYVGTAVFLYVFQARLVYFPSGAIERTPGDVGLAYRDADIVTKDGVKLHGWYVPVSNARGTILVCHGNAGNISHRIETILIFNRLGLNTLIFDYRGYGLSEGNPTEPGTYADAEAALAWIEEHCGVPPGEVVVFGRSLGGAVAACLASKSQPKALILESTFTSAPDMARQLYPWIPIRLLSRFYYDTLAKVREIHCPLLVVHSPDDDLIPFSHGRALFEAAPEPKEFFTIGGDHNSGFLHTGGRYVTALDTFLREYAGLEAE